MFALWSYITVPATSPSQSLPVPRKGPYAVRFLARSGVHFRRLAHTLAWNGLLVFAGAALIAVSAEAYMRAKGRFTHASVPRRSVPGFGRLYDPNTEVRDTNGLDFWTRSRTNSLGFIDREPPSPKRASETCHIAVIGDSFVDAREVPIADKLQVRLEELASSALPHLRITVSAFGVSQTGQIAQLAYYDEYARHLRPKLVVLVFVPNDFMNNYPVFRAMRKRLPHFLDRGAERMPNGELTLRLPGGPTQRPRVPQSGVTSRSLLDRAASRAERVSVFASWLRAKKELYDSTASRDFEKQVRTDPGYVRLFSEWFPLPAPAIWDDVETAKFFAEDDLHPIFEDALDYTAFALEQFKVRADRDGTQLVVLASHGFRKIGGKLFERLSEMSAAVEVPVVDQADWILQQGADLANANWAHDGHWNVAGHRWAAEALLEYIGEHQGVCARS